MSTSHCTPDAKDAQIEVIGTLRRFSVAWTNTVTGAHGSQSLFALDEEYARLWMRSELRLRDYRRFPARVYTVTVATYTAQGG